MFKNLLQIYSLLMCSIIVIILMVMLASSWKDATDLLLPQYKLLSGRHYDSNEDYLAYYRNYDQGSFNELLSLNSYELEKRRLAAKEVSLKSAKDHALKDLINLIGWLLVLAISLFIHWRIYKKSLSIDNKV